MKNLPRLLLATIASGLMLAACSTLPDGGKTPAVAPPAVVPLNNQLLQVLQSAARSPEARARDIWRHPAETLDFFGIKPGMTVVEIWPGAGWYSDILGPLLQEKGRLYAAHFPVESDVDFYRKSRREFSGKLQQSAYAGAVTLSEFMPESALKPAPDGSADLVLTFRNVHNWYSYDGDMATLSAFKIFYAALKPGGVLGVVEHRLPERRADEDMKTSGYMKQSYVIAQAQAAGFVLEARSEINANPRDNADHPQGVWTLPPTLRLGDVDRDKYLGIGESDRMTLKFRKPMQ